jgi:hypothetical protein
MPEVNPTKVALIQQKLRETAAKLNALEGVQDPAGPRLPILAEDVEQITFIGPAMEESFEQTTLLDLLTGPRPTGPVKPRDLNDLYGRVDKLHDGIEYLVRASADNRCMLAADIRMEMSRVQERLNEIDGREAKLKIGPLKMTFKWTGLITAIILLTRVPWGGAVLTLLGIFF